MVQNLTIDATVSDSSGFTDGMMGTDNLHELIDGTTADSPEGDYISGSAAVSGGLIVSLSDGDDPGVDTGHKIYFDTLDPTGPPPPGQSMAYMRIKLLQGVTVIKDWFTASGSGSGSFATPTTLSEAEAADITDYADLRFEFGVGGDSDYAKAFCVYLEIPDAQTTSPAFMLFVE